jgi:hypothetical protein
LPSAVASSGADSRLLLLSVATLRFAAATDSHHPTRQRTKKLSVASTVVWPISKSDSSMMRGEDSRVRRSLCLVSQRLGRISV